jgi:hypothetical protein
MIKLDDQAAMREVLEPIVRPVLANVHLENGCDALLDFLVVMLRTYNIDMLHDIALQIELNLDDDRRGSTKPRDLLK